MTVTILLLMLPFYSSIFCQSILEYPIKKMKGDVFEITEKYYHGPISLMADGSPDLSKATLSEHLVEYAHGLPIRKVVVKDPFSPNIGTETVYYYNPDKSLAKIELLELRASGKKRVWKSYELHYEKGQLVREHVYYKNGSNLRATFQYAYSKSENGNKIVDVTLIKPSDLNLNGKYHIEYDALGNKIYVTKSANNITGYIFKVLKDVGTTREYILEKTRRGKGEVRFTSNVKEHSKKDAQGNVTSQIIYMDNVDPKTGISTESYGYTEDVITYGTRKKSELDGLKNFITEADLEKKRLEIEEANKLYIPDFAFGSEREEPPHLVEEMPRFPGCEISGTTQREREICANSKLQDYISEHMVYPKFLKSRGMEGECTVQFIVNLDGTLDDIKIIDTNLNQIDKEALRIFQGMRANNIRWKAGKQRGKEVRVYYTVPVEFKL